jgi:membrane fusion protein, multidrug efflux system
MKTDKLSHQNFRHFIVSCVVFALIACAPSAPPTQTAGAARGAAAMAPTPVLVFRAPLRMQDWVDEISAVGTTSANESITLSAKVTETVARINFSDNDPVNAGDVLVELTGRAEVAALKEAQAAFVDADRQYERLSTVVKQGTVTRAQLDTQRAARDQAQARREAIRARLSDRVIVAPFSGVTGFRMVSPGALVTPGTAMTTLDDIDTLKLEFSVPENQLARVHVGDLVLARSSALAGQEFSGKVYAIDSRVDPASRSIKVRAKLQNRKTADGVRSLLPGMLLGVKLQAQTRRALALSEIAVLQQADQAYVYTLDANRQAVRVDIVLGARRSTIGTSATPIDGEVEVLSGLNESDIVIGEGSAKLRPGMAVELADVPVASDQGAPP